MFVSLPCCLTFQRSASVSQGRICSDNFMCCHTETEVADQTFYLTQSQYADTGPTSHSDELVTPGAWQGSSHWSANFDVTGMTRPGKISTEKTGIESRGMPLKANKAFQRNTGKYSRSLKKKKKKKAIKEEKCSVCSVQKKLSLLKATMLFFFI